MKNLRKCRTKKLVFRITPLKIARDKSTLHYMTFYTANANKKSNEHKTSVFSLFILSFFCLQFNKFKKDDTQCIKTIDN